MIDFLVMPQYDDRGKLYPPLSSFNDDDYKKYDGDKVLYILKANATVNSTIHNSTFAELSNGHVRFLIREGEAKAKLMATNKGVKMSVKDRGLRLAPYYQTTKLFEEIANLRVKTTGMQTGNTSIEQINKRILKDRFSAFEYGVWRIKQLEDEYFLKKRRKKTSMSKFMFFNRGGS